mmetsp:Transcript_15383/g.45569  ORF Transcript_15383/g.45569 Transcript_15383/m.45569 type:complete len:285 (-) Transcript_15383:281-1135(-)
MAGRAECQQWWTVATRPGATLPQSQGTIGASLIGRRGGRRCPLGALRRGRWSAAGSLSTSSRLENSTSTVCSLFGLTTAPASSRSPALRRVASVWAPQSALDNLRTREPGPRDLNTSPISGELPFFTLGASGDDQDKSTRCTRCPGLQECLSPSASSTSNSTPCWPLEAKDRDARGSGFGSWPSGSVTTWEAPRSVKSRAKTPRTPTLTNPRFCFRAAWFSASSFSRVWSATSTTSAPPLSMRSRSALASPSSTRTLTWGFNSAIRAAEAAARDRPSSTSCSVK